MSRLQLTLLGGFQARLTSSGPLTLPTRKAQALLAYLALPPGDGHPRDKLAALLWGGIREESARASLRQALFSIRKAVGEAEGALGQEGDALALDPAGVDVDVAIFERAVKEGTPEALERAATLYRGDLLNGFVLDEAPSEEWLLGERERLRELALEALARLLEAIATALGDRNRLAQILSSAGYTVGALGEHRRAIAIADRGRALAEETGNVLARIGADAMMGRAYYALGEYTHTIEAAGRAFAAMPEAVEAAVYERFGPRSTFQSVGARVWVAMSLAEQGHFAEANQRIEEAVAIADRAEAPHERVWSRFGGGRVAFVQGELARAAAFLEAILPQARSDLTIYISRIASTLGSTYLLAGRIGEALPLLEQAAAHGQSIGFMHGHSLVLALLAQGYLRAGRLDDATLMAADQALGLARKLGERGWEAWALHGLGELAAEQKTGEAAGHYRAALALASELGMRPLQAHCHRGLARVTGAGEEQATALDLYRTLEMARWLPDHGAKIP